MEPAHSGFVGGRNAIIIYLWVVFTSPPADSILAGIRVVTGPLGFLLTVKIYTGDPLN